jgi:hypothetical protein
LISNLFYNIYLFLYIVVKTLELLIYVKSLIAKILPSLLALLLLFGSSVPSVEYLELIYLSPAVAFKVHSSEDKEPITAP